MKKLPFYNCFAEGKLYPSANNNILSINIDDVEEREFEKALDEVIVEDEEFDQQTSVVHPSNNTSSLYDIEKETYDNDITLLPEDIPKDEHQSVDIVDKDPSTED